MAQVFRAGAVRGVWVRGSVAFLLLDSWGAECCCMWGCGGGHRVGSRLALVCECAVLPRTIRDYRCSVAHVGDSTSQGLGESWVCEGLAGGVGRFTLLALDLQILSLPWGHAGLRQ